MGTKSSTAMLYNVITIVFIALTLGCCLVTVMWVASPDSVPDALSPATAVPLPTRGQPFATFTSSPTVTNTATRVATWTPSPES